MSAPQYPVRIGELRPSQLLWAYGVGAIVDLPHVSAVVMGLDYWRPEDAIPVHEARLLNAVRRALGPQVSRLLGPPIVRDSDGRYNPFAPEARIGVPVSPFPRWLRCPLCQTLAEYDSGLFELKPSPYYPDRTRFVHSNCPRAKRPPTAVPARFLVACRDGHLDDFPWHWFVHRGPSTCRGQLRFFEQGASLQTENLWVACNDCDASRSLVEAFGQRGADALPACRGHHPHLGRSDGDCTQPLRAVLLGASNSWFPVTLSVLAIPTKVDKLKQLVEDKWDLLTHVPSREVLPGFLEALKATGQLPGISDFTLDEVWRVIEERRGGDGAAGGEQQETDLKGPEWAVFTKPVPESDWPDFMVKRVEVPTDYQSDLHSVVLAERLREVNALIGFTRVEPPDEGRDGGNPPDQAPLARVQPEWVPATEVRGEGIFLRFHADRIAKWLERDAVRDRERQLMQGHRAWRAARDLQPLDANFPGMVYVMLHTFAHVLIRELALECGYSAASIRERIYASPAGEPPEMAGILLYTSAPDSDGTLGGLVELGKPESLGQLIAQALGRARICSSDPLCAEHVPTRDRTLHGAACHACSFVAETSCERGNRYLDRALIVSTLAGPGLAFFDGHDS